MSITHWLLLGVIIMTVLPDSAQCAARMLPPECRRVVFLGSSTTDGHTYPALFRQALVEAGYAAPVCINAGIGGNTTAQIAARLERDVLAYTPTMVVLQAGANDPGAKVTQEQFRASVMIIAERLRKEQIPLVVLTTNIRGPKIPEQEALLQSYNQVLHELPDCRVADVYPLMVTARAAGENVIESDQIHPNFAGHRLITRALLDALGFANVPVPETLRLEVLPGVIREWTLHPHPDTMPVLDAPAVKALTPDAEWIAYRLPEDKPLDNWWLDCERRRGFALSLKERLGQAKRYIATATLHAEKAGQVYLNVGSELRAIWLDGEKVYQTGKEFRGWHAGRERIPVMLKAGEHALVIETSGQFFLSVTEDQDW